MSPAPTLNVTVLPEFAQSEGPTAVLDNLCHRAGITAITTSPYVMEPSDGPDAGREPPADAKAGIVRQLDRDLFGMRALRVRTSPSFEPDRHLYEGLRYQPPEPDALTHREGACVGDFIAQARNRGIKTYLQVQTAIPPGYRVQFGGPQPDDRCLMPDGTQHEGRVDKNASLASPHIKAYGCAMLRDLVRAYPDIDGIRIDWSEYPPYSFDSLFFDFSAHARSAAERMGYNFDLMRKDAERLHDLICGGITDDDLLSLAGNTGANIWALLENYPGVLALRQFKGDLVTEIIGAYRAALDDASDHRMELIVQGFPPPWSQASGFDVEKIAPFCSGIGVKLYTMHWPMMVRAYAERLYGANPKLTPRLLLAAIFQILDITDDNPPTKFQEVAYPGPDTPHLAGTDAQISKIRQVAALAGDTPVFAFAHGYGPIDDYRRRMAAAWQASGGRMVLNRYGYLSDQKLDILGHVTGRAA